MIKIRPLTIEDLDALLGLLGQLWPDKSVDDLAVRKVVEEGMKSDRQAYICAVEEEKLVGFCSLTVKNNLWLEARSGNVDELVVDVAYRNREIGKMLMAEIEKIAQARGCKRLDLESAVHRTVAHAFYEKLGFEKQEYSSFFFAKEIG